MVRTNSHAQTHTCTRSEVPVLHFLIHCYSPSPPAWSFYDSLSSSWAVWLQEGTSLLNSPCIFRRPVIKEGARAVKQRVGKRDINTSSLLSDSWTPDMSEKTNRKRRCKIGPVVKKRVIRGAQNLLLRVSHIHKKEKGTSTSELFRFLCMFHLPSKKPSHWFSCDVKMKSSVLANQITETAVNMLFKCSERWHTKQHLFGVRVTPTFKTQKSEERLPLTSSGKGMIGFLVNVEADEVMFWSLIHIVSGHVRLPSPLSVMSSDAFPGVISSGDHMSNLSKLTASSGFEPCWKHPRQCEDATSL